MAGADGDARDGSREAIAAQLAGEPKADLIVTSWPRRSGSADPGGGTARRSSGRSRRLFEALARRRPLVVVLDDLQWAEPTFLDLVEHVADLSRDAPIVLLCLARPELLDVRPGWGGGKLNAASILLEPLGADESTQLVENLLSEATLERGAPRASPTACEGNPLFAEELLAMLIDDGPASARRTAAGRSLDELAELPVPPTIHALLAARLERLPDEERALLARVSVEGTVFHREACASSRQRRSCPSWTGA